MQIDWSKIVTNAVSILVAATFVGAATLVWQSAVNQERNIKSEVEQAKHEVLTMQQDCHQHGLAVILDLVFNHAGAIDNILWAVARTSFFGYLHEAQPRRLR
jgi:hypothetical protein